MEALNRLDMQAILLLQFVGFVIFGIFGLMFLITLGSVIKQWIKKGDIWE
jgi:hypothetical protein